MPALLTTVDIPSTYCKTVSVILIVELNCKYIEIWWGTRWRSWLRHCATNRNVAGSIPDGLTGNFH
jgi:hypothetical protein